MVTSRRECSRWCSRTLGHSPCPFPHAVSSGLWFLSQKPWGNARVLAFQDCYDPGIWFNQVFSGLVSILWAAVTASDEGALGEGKSTCWP